MSPGVMVDRGDRKGRKKTWEGKEGGGGEDGRMGGRGLNGCLEG